MELEDKIQRIVENAKYCGVHSIEATRQILLLLDVVGRSEQLVCDKCKLPVEHDGEGQWCGKCQTYTYD
jgi:hypothetical protein